MGRERAGYSLSQELDFQGDRIREGFVGVGYGGFVAVRHWRTYADGRMRSGGDCREDMVWGED